jgi:hypothetical protein
MARQSARQTKEAETQKAAMEKHDDVQPRAEIEIALSVAFPGLFARRYKRPVFLETASAEPFGPVVTAGAEAKNG